MVTHSPSAAGPTGGRTAVATRFADARLFIVDDNPLNVALLVAVFTREGYRNLSTELDSRRVSARLPEVDPDLVVLDLHMPHLDGFEVLRQIREFAPLEALPVIVLTADSTVAAGDRALEGGAQDFITKPFSNGEVLIRTRNLLQSRFLYTTLRTSIHLHRESAQQRRVLADELSSEQQSGARLRVLNTVKDTLLQTVSHDVRNPLWALQVLTDVLEEDARSERPLDAAKRLEIIEKIGMNARRIDRLLGDVLDSDPMRASDERQIRCDVGDVVRRVLAEVDLGGDHPVETDLGSFQATIDPVHLERIVENMLNNAHQHLKAGTPVWIRVGPLEDGVVIMVEDAGPGVSPETAERIFQPFRRGADSAGHGLGLGLYLVSRFAELHGGRAWAQDREGGGSSFRVYLPSGAAVR